MSMHQPSTPTERMKLMEGDKNREDNVESGAVLLPPQVPVNLRIVSVYAACEELWRCQELEHAASWLQLLHHAILRDRLDAYDPSEAFLCLQGAALRFHAQQQQQGEENEQWSWAVWEESMWAAAALARVCVGPAWKMQLYQRRSWLHAAGNEWHQHARSAPTVNEVDTSNLDIADRPPPEVVTQHDTSPRSYSPMTASSFGNLSASRFDTWYPPIPEVLPAAMLRFAASAIEATALYLQKPDSTVADPSSEILHQQTCLTRRKNLGEAQRELVLALCCATPEEPSDPLPGGKRGDWSIPGANEPVGSMLLFWLETATTGWPSRKVTLSLNGQHTVQSDETALAKCGEHVESSAETEIKGESVADQIGDDITNRHAEKEESTLESAENEELPLESASLCEPGSSKDHISWSDVANSGAVDWWYVLQVTRAATDLVSNGWRPLLRSDIGAETVLYLLEIAEKGVLFRPSDLNCASSATNREAREERLAVASGAAEAVSALAALGAGGLLPHSSLSHTITILCRILVITTMSSPSDSSMYTLGSTPQPEEQIEWALEEEAFTTQRESCSADTADLLRILLSHHSSAVTSVSTLMRLIDTDLFRKGPVSGESGEPSLTPTFSEDNLHPSNKDEAVAIRVLGAALWGERSEISGVPSLRIFWLPLLDLFCKIGSSVHSRNMTQMSSSSRPTCADENSDSETCHSVSPYCLSSLAVALEITVAMGRLVEAELTLGDGLLTPSEWDAFVLTLDQSVIPWLSHLDSPLIQSSDSISKSAAKNVKMCIRLRSEVDALLVQLGVFLDRCATLGSPFHLIVDDTCRRQLHLLLLRKAIPYMEQVHATVLATSVIRSWASVGFLSCGSGELCVVASDILFNAFAVYENDVFGYAGGYVHSPSVRLEALAAITHDEGDKEYDLPMDGSGDDASHEASKISTVSPLTLTRNMREQYLELLNVTILPHVVSILGADASRIDVPIVSVAVLEIPANCKPASRNSSVVNNDRTAYETDGSLERFEMASTPGVNTDDEFQLRMYAIRLLGRLFCSSTVERHHRTLFVQTLRSVASMKEKAKVSLRHRRPPVRGQPGNAIDSNFLNVSHELGPLSDEFCFSLEAIRQIEICLCATFFSLPHAHQSVPLILDTLCSVLDTYGRLISTEQASENIDVAVSRRIGTIAALLPLCRLSVSCDRHLVLMEKKAVSKHARAVLLELQGRDGDKVPDEFEGVEDVDDEPVIAPFVTVSISRQCISLEMGDDFNTSSIGPTTEKTSASLLPVVSVLVFLLQSSAHVQESSCHLGPDHAASVEVKEVTARLRSTCFDALSNLILSGVTISRHADIAAALKTPLVSQEHPYEREEKASRCRAIGVFAEYVCACGHRSAGEDIGQIAGCGDSSLNMLLQLCISRDCIETVLGCRALVAVLPVLAIRQTVCHDGNMWVQVICTSILSRLQNALGLVVTSEGEVDHSSHSDDPLDVPQSCYPEAATVVALLSVLYGVFSEKGMSPGPERQRQTFYLCHEICSSTASRLNWFDRVVALHCVAMVVGRMAVDDVVDTLSTLSYKKDSSSSPASLKEHDCCRLSTLTLDFLVRRHQHLVECDSASFAIESGMDQPLSHEYFAKETEDIEQFIVESKEKCSAGPNVAWMCGDSILTCRLGASSSRYRGWMEVIVRSPSTRQRRMIRLSGKISVENPELTSSMWTTDGDKEFPRLRAERIGQSDAMSRALALIERCDSSLANTGIDNDLIEDNSQLSNNPKQRLDNGRNHEQSQGLSSAMYSPEHAENMDSKDAQVVEGGFLQRSPNPFREIEAVGSSDANISADEKGLSHKSATFRPVVPSVHHWLITLFGDSSNVRLVEDQLRLLGFSEDMLQMAPTRLTKEAQQDDIFRTHWPVQRLQDGPKLCRALSILDRTPTLHTHKIALLFAGPATVEDGGVDNNGADRSFENHILRATHGSPDFLEFTTGISDMILTRHLKFYSGGLDTSDYASDGEYAAFWIEKEESSLGVPKTMVLFHLVTLMPSGLNNRKRHVGNDNVHIVYVEQGFSIQHENDTLFHAGDPHELQSAVVSGEFGFVTIFVVLLKQADLVRVSVRSRTGLPEDTNLALQSFIGTYVVARAVAPEYVRRIAVLTDLACRSTMEDRLGLASNWEERRNQIRDMGRYLSRRDQARKYC